MKFWKRYIENGESRLAEIQPSKMDFSRPMVIVLPGENVLDKGCEDKIAGSMKIVENFLGGHSAHDHVSLYAISYTSNRVSYQNQIRSNGGLKVGNFFDIEASEFVDSVILQLADEGYKTVEEMQQSLRKITFFAQSHGTIFVQMIQAALDKKLPQVGYSQEEIARIQKEMVLVGVGNISRTDYDGNSLTRILVDGNEDKIAELLRVPKEVKPPKNHFRLSVSPMKNGLRVVADVPREFSHFKDDGEDITFERIIDQDRHTFRLYSEFGPHQPGHVDITAYALRNAVKRTGTIEDPLDLLIPSLPLGKSMYDVPHPNQLYGHTAKIIAAAIERGKSGGHKR